jgi:tetratricopeptide (TPR) repeat protein
MALAVLLVLGSPALAGPLDDAKLAVEASEYLKARAALTEALAGGANGREELAEIYRLSGIVNGALGDPKAATAAFQRALALSPKLELAPGTSPKITRPFAAAQGLAKQSAPLEIKSETGSAPPSVTVIVASDPLAMIAHVRVAVVADGQPEQSFERPAAERVTVELPAGARLDVRIAAVDEHGNRLAELGSREVPIVVLGTAPPPPPKGGIAVQAPRQPPPPPPPPASPRPLHLRWWMWAGGAVAFGAASAYFGIDAWLAKRELDDLNASSVQHSFDEAKDVEARARRGVLLTNIGWGVTGALAIGAGILYLTEPRQARGERRVTVAPVRGGGALVFGGRF